ncbi:MAG: DUF1573 domain-containing protein [Sphingobacteriaceae bacterium]|nr:DUF1573 domain-containing protein [Sphingobacteriaceae bacterium]
MKNILILLSLSFIFSCTEKKENKTGTDLINNSASATDNVKIDLPEIKFEEEEFDFGKITQGERVEHSFKFKNIGAKNLVISGANGSCGCTIADWPKEPIASGAEGKIEVVFNSEGKSGFQEKTITIVTNCEPATRILRIKTEIIVAETAK